MNTKKDNPTEELGTVVRTSECILPAPVLGQVWKKGQGPFWRPNIRAQLHEGQKRTKACPNGRVKRVQR